MCSTNMQIKAKESPNRNVAYYAVDCENVLLQLLESSVFHHSFYFRIQCCVTKSEAFRDHKSVSNLICVSNSSSAINGYSGSTG